MSISKKIVSLVLAVAMVASISLLAGCGSKGGSSAGSSAASTPASTYPEKNVNVIVPFGAGGNTDMSVRALLNVASEQSDVTFVVDNKTGNAGLVGMEALAESTADGYTIGAICIDLQLHICFGRTDLTMDSFIPLAATMADPYGLVISSTNPNFTDLKSFVEYAKANPGAVKIGTSGAGAAPHLAALAFEKYLGVQFSYYTYDGSADCVTAIASGEIDGTFTQPTPAASQIQSGTESMICILNDVRLDSYAETPTLMEVYPEADLVMKGWVAVAAPAGTPDDVVTYLTELLGTALQTDEYKASIESLGMQYMVLYGEDLKTMINDAMSFYEEICAGVDLNA